MHVFGEVVVGQPDERRRERGRQREAVVHCACPDPELHDVRVGSARARVHQREGPTPESMEVDQHIGALGRGQSDLVQRQGRGQQAAVAAYLAQRTRNNRAVLVVKPQRVEARVGGIEHPEAVPASVDGEMRPDHPVDQGEGPGERQRDLLRLGEQDGQLVQELPSEVALGVGIEVAVADDQRHFVLTVR